jgi:hypothetical protein
MQAQKRCHKHMSEPIQLNPNNPAAIELKEFFKRNGYVRLPDKKRRKMDSRNYKKGYEVRLVLKQSELPHVRRLLQQSGFRLTTPFAKLTQIVQPIYGKAAIEFFLSRRLP